MPFLPRSPVLLALSYAVFGMGLGIAGSIYFSGRVFDARDLVISDLVSPDDNPHGYAVGAAGIAIASLLVVPGVVRNHLRLRVADQRLAWAGTLLSGAGLTAALAIGVLAPMTHDYTFLHVQLAFAAFIGVCAGTTMHLAVARQRNWVVLGFQCCVLLFLGYLYFHPRFFGNTGLVDSLAFWEWMLCGNCAVLLWAACYSDRE
jgi:hypothetical protein